MAYPKTMEEENIRFAWINSALTILKNDEKPKITRILGVYRLFLRNMLLHHSTREIDLYDAARNYLKSILEIIENRIEKRILFEAPEIFVCCTRMYYSIAYIIPDVSTSATHEYMMPVDEDGTFPHDLCEWAFDIIPHSQQILVDLKYYFARIGSAYIKVIM